MQSAKHCGREKGPNLEGQLGACLLSAIPEGQMWQRCWENPSAGRHSHLLPRNQEKQIQALERKQTPVKIETYYRNDRQILISVQNLIFSIFFEMFLCWGQLSDFS